MKRFFVILFSVAAMQYVVFADNSNRTVDLKEISGINVTDGFNVVMRSGMGYSVSLNVDSRLYDYCHATMQGSTLNLEVDEKSFPKELKSQLKKSTEKIALNAVVTIPSNAEINSINVEDESTLDISTDISMKGKMSITLSDNAKVFGLNVSDASRVNVSTSKKAQFDGNVNSKELAVKTANSSNVHIDAKCSIVEIDAGGSSNVVISGSSDETTVSASNSAKVNLGGSIDKLTVSGKGNSEVDAGSLKLDEAVVELNSSDCTVAAQRILSVSIQNNSTLVFDGNPEMNIVKVLNSSIIRASDAKSNKK